VVKYRRDNGTTNTIMISTGIAIALSINLSLLTLLRSVINVDPLKLKNQIMEKQLDACFSGQNV
jgi:hypothetical protein